MLSSDIHPLVRLNMQMGLYANWTRSQEGRVMTAGDHMNVQGASYSRVYDRVEHGAGLYAIDIDPIVDSYLSADEIQGVARKKAILHAAIMASKTYEPPSLGDREYKDPTMEDLVAYTLQREKQNQKRFGDIQKTLTEYGSELEIEQQLAKAKQRGDEALVGELEGKLAFVKAY